jgi:hypothetical protein
LGVVVPVETIRVAAFEIGVLIEELVTYLCWKRSVILLEHIERFVAGEVEPIALRRIGSHLRGCPATPSGYRQRALDLKERELPAKAGAGSVFVHRCLGGSGSIAPWIDPLRRSAALAAACLLTFEPAAPGRGQHVAPLAAMVGANDLGEAEITEPAHLAVQGLQLVEERPALPAEPRLEVAVLTMRDEADDRLGGHASPPVSGRRV